ncbi:protein patched homolog 2 isoform X5 [Pipistrellus kuhlii]|uniref:protein patched homolog 2 isoform X5 n=1 Tax=Pipistrellus kuhlii TaxID=59472 RepID=UPI001E2723FF|nr:protein patched homolog 2 isoform X5 [Pipistrellus kuhlii]
MGQGWRQRRAERRSWLLGQQIAFLSIGLSRLYLAGASLSGSPSPSSPRALGGEARPGEARRGWPCLGGLRLYPPRRRCLAADPGRADLGNLRAPQPMGERRPCPLPFSGATDARPALRSHLEPRERPGLPAPRDSLRPRPPVTAPAARPPPTLSRAVPLNPHAAPRYRGTRPAYGGSQITRAGGAQPPHSRQHGSAATPRGAASGLHAPSRTRSAPAGSRVSRELQYTKEKLGEEAAYTSQMLIQTPRREGEDVLTPAALRLHLQAALAASKVQVSLFGKSWDLNKICYKSGVPLIENGMIERMIEKLFPCVILTPLDCFWEGAKLQGGSAYLPGRPDIQWTNLDPEQLLEELGPFASLEGFRELLAKAQVGQAYVGRPCLNPDDPHCPPSAPNYHSRQAPPVAQELSGGCHGFSHKFMHWQEELLLGGTARAPQGQLLRAEALQSTFLLMSPRQLYEHFRGDYQTHDIGWSEEQAGTVLQAWQRRFVQLAQEALPENASQQIHAFSSTTLDDILHAFSEVSAARVAGGYLLMLAYACVTMLRWDCAQSQGAVGLAGVLLVALAVASGLGLCALLGIAFNAATTQVLPFLALGIGVDDIFLLAHAFAEAPPGTPLQERMGECLLRAGPSVALTSINNMVAFFMAALVPIPALRAFSLQAAVVVACNFAAVMLVFPAILSLDLHRRHCQRLDVLCCFSSPCSARVIQILPQELADRMVPVGIAHLTATVHAFAHCEAGSQHVVTSLPPQAHLVPAPSDPLSAELFSPGGSTRDLLGQEEGTGQKAAYRSLPCARWTLAHFARHRFAPLLLQSQAKASRLRLTRTGLLAASPATRTATAPRTGRWPTSCWSRRGTPGSLWTSARWGAGGGSGGGRRAPRPAVSPPSSAAGRQEAGGRGGADPARALLRGADRVGEQRPPGPGRLAGQLLPPAPRVAARQVRHHRGEPAHPGGPAPGVCPVPLPAARPPEDGGLRGGDRGSPGSVRRGGPGRGARLPQRLSLPLLGAVPGPAALLPAGRLHPAGVHLPRLCPAAAQPLDRRPHRAGPGGDDRGALRHHGLPGHQAERHPRGDPRGLRGHRCGVHGPRGSGLPGHPGQPEPAGRPGPGAHVCPRDRRGRLHVAGSAHACRFQLRLHRKVLLRGADGAHAPGPPPWAGAAACAAVHPGPPTRGGPAVQGEPPGPESPRPPSRRAEVGAVARPAPELRQSDDLHDRGPAPTPSAWRLHPPRL